MKLACCEGVELGSFKRCSPPMICIHVTDHERTDHEGVQLGEVFVYILVGLLALLLLYMGCKTAFIQKEEKATFDRLREVEKGSDKAQRKKEETADFESKYDDSLGEAAGGPAATQAETDDSVNPLKL